MKKIIAAMLLSIGCASAKDASDPVLWPARLPNDLQIIFADQECPIKHIKGRQIAGKLRDDTLIFGCWHEVGNQVVVFWVVDSERDILKIVEWEKADIRFIGDGPWEGFIKYGTTQI